MATNKRYDPRMYGEKEVQLIKKFNAQYEDAKDYFISCIKPRLDRSYKLYIAYTGDRAAQIKSWQANVFVPYIHGVVETLMPRVLDARPDFTVQGRQEDDQLKAIKVQNLNDYTWEIASADTVSEDVTRSSMVYGMGYMQASWKKDEREHEFLSSKDLLAGKYKWKKKKQIFYDSPFVEWVDNYSLWYDWRNIPRESKQFWFKRLILSGAEIKRKYPLADKERLEMALANRNGDLTAYDTIRNSVKWNHDGINKDDAGTGSIFTGTTEKFSYTRDPDLRMFEVFEWWRPFDDKYSVMVNNVPILKGAEMPIPYDFKEAPFIGIPFLRLPGEYEGMGLPMILESPQIMLNLIKNQRLDAATLNIHKMWIVNPLANINKGELVTRPFGIIYSTDPNGVREVEFSDIKQSSYREEELLKGDMRYASGVDDFSMGVGQGANSATEVRHLRESTLERVRLFINHLGDGYSQLMRYWISMWRQFMTDSMRIRITGENGEIQYPLIEKDDLMGNFDFRASVIPSIAGKNDIDKKQNMDLFQLLINLPFVDPEKLTAKVLHSWNWSLDSVLKSQEGMAGAQPGGMPGGMPGAPGGMTPEMLQAMGQQGMLPQEDLGAGVEPLQGEGEMPMFKSAGDIPAEVMQGVLRKLGGGNQGVTGMKEAAAPINLLQMAGMPPTAPGIPAGKTTNPRGMNMGGKVNTNIATNKNTSIESNLMNRAANIQR
jgi:hypothetical protein